LAKGLAVITGASAGLGVAFARRLAADGHDLLLVARRLDRLQSVAADLEKSHGIRAEPFAVDLTNDAELALVEDRVRQSSNLEVLVNNAGFGTLGRFFEVDVAGQDAMHRLHVIATMRLTHAALLNMVPRRSGAIINVSSVAAFAKGAGSVSYCATKAWMNAFTEGLYTELKSAGSPVRVQALCPGYTITEFHDTLGFDRKLIPKRWWMSADDVVSAAMAGLARNRVIVIPGWRYRLLVAALQAMPGSLQRKIGEISGRRAKRDRVPERN
jgi:short-subunit dehydrogenase